MKIKIEWYGLSNSMIIQKQSCIEIKIKCARFTAWWKNFFRESDNSHQITCIKIYAKLSICYLLRVDAHLCSWQTWGNFHGSGTLPSVTDQAIVSAHLSDSWNQIHKCELSPSQSKWKINVQIFWKSTWIVSLELLMMNISGPITYLYTCSHI